MCPKLSNIMPKPVLYIDGEALDAGALPSISVERHNPLLSEGQQSYSYPFILPRTGRNERLLGFPSRYQRTQHTQRSFPCTLLCGHVQRIGALLLNSISNAGYDCSMTFDTARLLGDIGDKKLVELPWTNRDFTTKENLASKIEDSYFGRSTSNLSFMAATFQLAAYMEGVTFNGGIETYYASMLNNRRLDVTEEKPTYKLHHTNYIVDGSVVELPLPFGLAPFLRVDFVLKSIFEDMLGYRLNFGNRAYNPLEHICMLHNSADVVVDGMLRVKQLVADCTVKDFVKSIENMFCSKFILDANVNVVRWVLWNDFLPDNRPPNDEGWIPRPNVADGSGPKLFGPELRPYLEDAHSVEMLPRRAIKLTMQRNLNSKSKLRWLNVITPQEYYSDEVEEEWPPSMSYPRNGEDVRGGRLVKDSRSEYCNTFNYHNSFGISDSEDIDIPAEHIPTANASHNAHPAYDFGLSFFNSSPPANPSGEEVSDEKATRPLAFASYYFSLEYGMNICKGTTIGRYETMEPKAQSLRLHLQEGLFSVYHHLRDALIRGGVYRLTAKLDRTIAIDENAVYLLDGQPVMVESVLEALGSDEPQTVTLQTLKTFE